MSQSKNIQRWIDRIGKDSSSDSVLVDALLKLRPMSKRHNGIKDIHNHGGIKCFIKLIQRPNRKILDISISLLANCLTEEKVREEVLNCQGITPIVKLLQTIKDVSIITRTCRSIANLANNSQCSNNIHSVGAVQLIVKVVKDCSDPDCLNSALRALRNLANTPGHRKKLVQCGAVAAIARCLDSHPKTVLVSATSTLAAISQSCTLEFADHMLGNDADAIKKLVKLVNEDETVGQKCKDDALSIIIYLTLQGCARPTIGGVGGLKCIVDHIRMMLFRDGIQSNEPLAGPLYKNAFCLVGALCYCCREAINRARLRSLDALPLFVSLLTDNRWHCVHTFILNTLLCFVYDEEGLKYLHESGIFHILLVKLQDFTRLEKAKAERRSKEESKHGASSHSMWDGHHLHEDENFDRRHSLSFDVPTKFNQRPTADALLDTEIAANAYTGFEVDSRTTEGVLPYSPQWSPAGPSPVPEELAFANDPSPSQSPLAVRPLSASDTSSSNSRSSNSNEPIGVRAIRESPLDQDESSSSRDGFDSMHSPALLPVANFFKPVLDDESSSAVKRDRANSCSSDESGENLAPNPTTSNEDLMTKGGEDLRQASKRARIENLKENDPRFRSRSLDMPADTKEGTGMAEDVFAAPSSPPSELTLPDMGDNVCSPSFLQFVSETCSVSPLVLQQAGRDVGTASSSTGSGPSTSVFKQARRRRSSGGGSKKTENPNASSVSTSAKEATDEASTAGSSASEDVAPSSLQSIGRSLTGPLTSSKVKPSLNPAKDSVLAGPDPVTLDQVILCLLCHYCEMSDIYVISLAQQEECAKALSTYVKEYPKKLYSKLHRILDLMTSCPACFHDIVSSFFVTSLAAASHQRRLLREAAGSSVLCEKCKLRAGDCEVSLDTMWHNTALMQSTIFGSNSLKRMLTKGDEAEILASTCTLLLLALWYGMNPERLKNAPSSMLKYLISDLQVVVEKQKIDGCLTALAHHENEDVFSYVAYSLSMLCQIQAKRLQYEREGNQKSNAVSTAGQGQLSKDTKAESPSAHTTKCECLFEQAMKVSPPDKTLIFESCVLETPRKRNLRRRRCGEKANERPVLKIHVEKVSTASPVLSGMFLGKYRESTEDTVIIKDVPYKAAVYVIHKMYGCSDRGCAVMKNIIPTKTSRSPMRYEDFCSSESSDSGRKECPVEISILRVMDLWLLQDMRKEFCTDHACFFHTCYVQKEIRSVCARVGRLDGGHTVPCRSGGPGAKTLDLHHGWFFLKFAANHGFSDVVEDYIKVLLLPCLYNHNYMLRGKVYSSLTQSMQATPLLAEWLNVILQEVISQFEIFS